MVHCLALSELPPPLPSKTGWPWTEESPQLPDTMPDGSPWPRVSIVTPSYNQVQFIEETIRSVLLQGYPNLEYIIIDGGSNDGSRAIIDKYANWITHSVSEPDRGQSEAINKGLRRTTGEILAWLNSDDLYLPGTVPAAVQALETPPRPGAVYSNCRMVNPGGQLLAMYCPISPLTLRTLLMYWRHHYACPPQPTVFFRRQFFEQIGYLDETLHYALDYEYWLRAVQQFEFRFVDATWAAYTVHAMSKTGKGWGPFAEETVRVGIHHMHRLGYFDRLLYRYAAKRLIAARHDLDDAFSAFYAGQWSQARRLLQKAVKANPSFLARLGVVRLLLRTLSFAAPRHRDSPEIGE